MTLCTEGWLRHANQERVLKSYWPSAMRNDVLAKLHEGHQRMVKCEECAHQSVCWPRLSQQVKVIVLNCRTRIQDQKNHKEPLMQSECPKRPWQKLGVNLLELGGKTYLLVIDYFSRYVEIAQSSHSRCAKVIGNLNSILVRHGIPAVLMSDNELQLSEHAFTSFTVSYGFKQPTAQCFRRVMGKQNGQSRLWKIFWKR